MSTNPKSPAPKPPKDIEVDVKNTRYEGATIEVMAKALLQHPRKVDQKDDGEPPDETKSGGA